MPPIAANTTIPAIERHDPHRPEPAPVPDLGLDRRLEALEPRRHRRALVLDLPAELGQAPAAPVEDVVDDGRHRLLPGRQLDRLAGGELEVGDALVAETAPDAALGGDVLGRVVATSDQVEEGRRELEGARLPSLTEERRHERGLRVGRRLLLVLAVVAGLELPAEAPEHEHRDRERGEGSEREHDQRAAPRVGDRVVDALLVPLVRSRVRLLLGGDLLQPVAVANAHARRGRERVPWIERAELDELTRVDVERPEQRLLPLERDVAADPDRVAPGADDVAGPAHGRGQAPEPLLPLVAPDLEVHVDDVVVAHGEPGHAVVDEERALLDAVRLEPPDDPHAPAEVVDAERAGRAARLEIGRRARPEGLAVLGHADLVDPLARPVRDLAVAVGERARERDGDRLVDRDRAVRTDGGRDVAGDELVGLALRDPGEGERGDDGRRERERSSRSCHRARSSRRCRARRAWREARTERPGRRPARSRPAVARAASRRSRRTPAS